MTEPFESRAVRVTLVRHGQSESNRHRRWQGHGDSPLSELGRVQAAKLGARLRRRTFDRVFSSDLQRAADTARAIGKPVEAHARFREFDVGALEGLTHEEVEAKFPEQMAALAAGEDIALGGGESRSSFARRVDDALRFACDGLDPGAHVLIVCHGGFIGAALARALRIGDRKDWPLARVSNTSVTELTWHPDGCRIEVFNDDLHLGEERPSLVAAAVREVGIAVGERNHDLGHLRPWLEAAQHAYDLSAHGLLPAWLARLSVGTGTDLSPLASHGRLPQARAWLSDIVRRHGEAPVACVASSALLTEWARELLWVGGDPSGPGVSGARGGTWSRAHVVGEQVVLDCYNADPRR